MIETILLGLATSLLTQLARRLRVSSEVVAAVIAVLVSGVAIVLGGSTVEYLLATAADVFLKANGLYALYLGWKKKGSVKKYLVK